MSSAQNRRRTMTAVASGVVLGTVMAAGMAVADPNIQVPGTDDGLPNCAVLNINAFAGYIGTGAPTPTRAMDESFAAAPVGDWCNTNVGYSFTKYGADGVTMVNPRTVDGLFPYNNSEILARPVFEPGQTMTMDIEGAPDIDPGLLAADHSYAVRLDHERVEFFVDGGSVGAFTHPPHGAGVNILGKPVPLLGQMWLDGSYWFPLPIPEYNAVEQRLTMTRYRQGPSATTPLT